MGSIIYRSHGFHVLFHDHYEDFRIRSPRLPHLIAGEEINLLQSGDRSGILASESPFGDREKIQQEVDAYITRNFSRLTELEHRQTERWINLKNDPPTFEVDGCIFHLGQRVITLGRSSPSNDWKSEPHWIGDENGKPIDSVDTPLVLINVRPKNGKWLVTLAMESDWMKTTGAFQVPDGDQTWQRKLIPVAAPPNYRSQEATP